MVTVSAQGADGDLDPSFGTDGKVTIDIQGTVSNESDDARAVAIQSDGKIVVAGYTIMGGVHHDFAVARLNPDGSLDPTFGIGGKVTTDFSGSADVSFDVAWAMAIQSDGKIVVVGSANNGIGQQDIALARYRSNGSLDPSFGIGGKVTTDFPGSISEAHAIAIQPDGKIVVAGAVHNGVSWSFALARYRSNGRLDPSFGIGGKLTTDFSGDDDIAFTMAIQRDGKIVVAGYTYNGSRPLNQDFALARYNPDGSLDPNFGTGGKLTTDFAGSDEVAYALAIEPDGKIVVAGNTYNGVNQDFALARYNPDGSLDPNFGTGGKVTTDFSALDDVASAMAIQPDGKIIVVGYTYGPTSIFSNFALARYDTNGSLDPSFGTGGKVTTDSSGGGAANTVAIQPDAKIVVAGVTGVDFALARYLSEVTTPQLSDLIDDVGCSGAPTRVIRGLCAKLEAAQNALSAPNAGDTAGACKQLTAFIRELRAVSPKKIPVAQAKEWITVANQIKAALGCS